MVKKIEIPKEEEPKYAIDYLRANAYALFDGTAQHTFAGAVQLAKIKPDAQITLKRMRTAINAYRNKPIERKRGRV